MKDEYVSKEAVLEYIRKVAETAHGDGKDAIGDAYNYLADDLEMGVCRPAVILRGGEYVSKKEVVDNLCFDYAYAAADIVKKMPGVDVAPVVHGRWKAYGVLLECQNCGGIYLMLGGNVGMSWDYCPSCGAKMDKEEACEADILRPKNKGG